MAAAAVHVMELTILLLVDTMKDFGLLWIPAGFLLIFGSVAALFLTI